MSVLSPHHQTLIAAELHRLESLGYIGLLGRKYLSPNLTTPDPKSGKRVRAVNISPKAGWAIVAYGKPGEEMKHKFLRDVGTGWVYDGIERLEAVH